MAKLSDTKIPITEFLESYRRQPCLYNSLLDTYKNRVAREEAYEAIIKSLKIPHLTVLDIKLKIKSVRTVYTKELRILMREKELGRCYEPKLFWFKRADSFLRSVSLSHCKRLKNKNGDVDNPSVTIKKEVPQKILLTASTGLIEDALQGQEQEPDEEVEEDEESQTAERLHDDGHENKLHASTATNTNNNKTELVIDDSSISITDQQQQQQQAAQRKLKYMPYVHQLQSQHQQQQQRLSTPFTSPSPSSQQLNDLSTSSAAALCFATPNGNVNNSNDDDLIIFGQSIASQLRSIPDPYSRSLAKLRIQQVLFEAETGQNSEAVSPHLHSF